MARAYTLKQEFLPEGIPCDSGELIKGGPSSVTIHWIGAYPEQSIDEVRSWWEKGGGEASAHIIIKDDEACQCWPFDKVAWHAGNSEGNRTSVGIEVVPMNTEGEFSKASIKALKAILNDFFPDLPIKRHYDWSGKDCPAYYVDEARWKKLKKELGRA